MTSLTAAADYVVNNYITSPLPTIFGDFAPKILLSALLLHRLAVSPLTKLVERHLVPFFAVLKTTKAQFRADRAAEEAQRKALLSTDTFES